MAFDFLGNLAQLGFFDIILPWTLFFAIVYGLLGKLKLFGDNSDKINLVIAIVIAFFGVNYTTVGVNVGNFLTNLFGVGGLGLSVVLLIAILVPLLGGDKLFGLLDLSKPKEAVPKIGLVLALIGIGAYFFTGGGKSLGSLGFSGISSELLTTIVVLAIMLGVIAFVFYNTNPTPSGGTSAPAGGAHHECGQ